MTNERKILILKDIQKNYIFGTEPWDVLDMEIKALSQEPTYYPPCIDCNKKMDEIRRAYDKLKEQEPTEYGNLADVNDIAIALIYSGICDSAKCGELKEVLSKCIRGAKIVATESEVEE